MIIINTTYHASDNIKEIFINWIKEIYIPTALQHEELSEPQLCRIIAHALTEKFKDQVVGFTTLLEIIE